MNIPTGFGQVNLIYAGTAYPRGAQVTFGFGNEEDLSPDDVATAIAGFWFTQFGGVTSDICSLQKIKVKLGPNDTGPETTLEPALLGANSSQPLPNQVAVLSRKITASGGRHNRGRSFWPGATEGQTDGAGKLSAAALSDWQDAVNGFWVACGAADFPWFILHEDELVPPTAVTNIQVDQLMASQRRRLRKVGGRRRVTP